MKDTIAQVGGARRCRRTRGSASPVVRISPRRNPRRSAAETQTVKIGFAAPLTGDNASTARA